jgi:F-type H+-transporting ATPase subunit beta
MAKGKVVQVIGTVVDMEFPQNELPAIYNGIVIPLKESKIIVEVQAHIGNNWVRGVALTPTDGLARGVEAMDMGAPISVPVGRATLGRLFNVFGEAIDGLGEVNAEEKWPIHRPPPPLTEQETVPQMLETGLAVRLVPMAAPGWVKPLLLWSSFEILLLSMEVFLSLRVWAKDRGKAMTCG